LTPLPSWLSLASVQLVLKSPNEAPYEAGKDFSVMISFDDSVAAARADDVLQLLGQNLKAEEGRLFHQWWHVEDLAFTAMRELAALEAAMADILIIVIHHGRQLTGMVAVWLERVAALRKDRPKTLVALLDSDVNEPDAALRPTIPPKSGPRPASGWTPPPFPAE